MKTKEELNALKVEVETVNKKLAELTVEELVQVSGGMTEQELVELATKQLIDIMIKQKEKLTEDMEQIIHKKP